jgi:hypothetical protein
VYITETVSSEMVDAFSALSIERLVQMSEDNFNRSLEPMFLSLLRDMYKIGKSRIDSKCKCGNPVDLTGRFAEISCAQCYYGKKRKRYVARHQ